MSEFKGKKYIIFLFQIVLIALLTVFDAFTKIIAEDKLKDGDYTVIKNVLSFSYVKNTGAAFGSFKDSAFMLCVITSVFIAVGITLLYMGKFKGFKSVCAILIIAGGTGNNIDRFTKQYVVDFIRTDFINFPVFNVADILVTTGVFLTVGYLIFDVVRDVKNQKTVK